VTSTAPNPPVSTGPGPAPTVVALGGGHGLAATLEAASSYAHKVVGVVSVADDGGSSGVLRSELGVEAPGDARRCISALAADRTMLGRTLEYRFESGALKGHPIGNLLLAGLTVAGGGGFQQAINELCRIVGLEAGSICAATDEPVVLEADSDYGPLRGQVRIEDAPGIRSLRFDPADPQVSNEVIEAVGCADQIIIGPGSLFTSVLAAVCVPRIVEALCASSAQRVFVANVANERALARGFGLEQHVNALVEHGVPVDVVVAHGEGGATVGGLPVRRGQLSAADGWGHDPVALGNVLWSTYCSG